MNGITFQANCPLAEEIYLTGCSHAFAVKVFVASFARALIGCQFEAWFLYGKCENPTEIGLNMLTRYVWGFILHTVVLNFYIFFINSARGEFYANVDVTWRGRLKKEHTVFETGIFRVKQRLKNARILIFSGSEFL